LSNRDQKIRFGVIGINHGHIYDMVRSVSRGGGELVNFYAKEDDLAADFREAFPQCQRVENEAVILEDPSIQLIASAGINNERAPLGIKVMEHGKDFMSDKPAFTTMDQLAAVKKVQAESNRIYSICYSERLANPATVKAGQLAKEGRIGNVIQTIGLGPHRISLFSRPKWFFNKEQYGGILCDIASHQFDQFLFFTRSTDADIVASQVGNFNHPEYPEFEDFGDVIVRSREATGYIRVDWFTPDGLSVWGDGRLIILGTEGYIEIRKYIDLAGKEGGNHLFLVDKKGMEYIDCSDVKLTYGAQLVDDVLNRTQTAMKQEHAFLASELALKAELNAEWVMQKSE
jgi:predicted dehydrogenase